MATRLVWITPEAESQIAYCARVSNPKNQDNPDAARLLRYCAQHKHWSVFEMASMCVEIDTTRDIAAQILRHRSFSFQEFSQRYSPTDLLGQAQPPELRLQDTKNKQNSLPWENTTEREQFTSEINDLFDEAQDLYLRLLDAGVAKECARKVLPLNTPTRLYMSGTLRSWIHYCQVRTEQGTQKEHRQIALSVWKILSEQCPAIATAVHELRNQTA